jgi:hypothetical protein
LNPYLTRDADGFLEKGSGIRQLMRKDEDIKRKELDNLIECAN